MKYKPAFVKTYKTVNVKKHLVFVCLALMINAAFGSSEVTAQSKISEEEYEIYSSVFNKMFEGGVVNFDTRAKIKLLVIKNYTVKDFSPLKADSQSVKIMLPALLPETVDGYAEANKKEYRLKDAFNLELDSVLVKKSAVEKIFNLGTAMGEVSEWEEFYEKFPDSGGIVGISRVGFNPAKNQALVYFEHWCHSLCGTGHYVLLRKEQGKWRFLKNFSPWIS